MAAQTVLGKPPSVGFPRAPTEGTAISPRRAHRQHPVVAACLLGLTLGAAALLSDGGARRAGVGSESAAASTTTPSGSLLPAVDLLTGRGAEATAEPTPIDLDGAGATGDPAVTAGTPAPEPALIEPVATAPAVEVPPPPPEPVRIAAVVPSRRLPLGKGMWLHQLSQAGSAESVVDRARSAGLTHIYLRLGSSRMGFYNQPELDRLLPVAHGAGIKVVGWDFVYLTDPVADARRAFEEIGYHTPDGHSIDAFSADIETVAEGVDLTAGAAAAYGKHLRELVGPGYPLIATVPRPPRSEFPYAEATAAFDAIAPMVYWMNRDPAADVTGALAALLPFGKPVLPIGQAYDGGPEGGPPGKPPKEALVRFMDAALDQGALGVSFWVWHHMTPDHWAAVREAKAWELPAGLVRGAAVYLQRVLGAGGHPVAVDGRLGPETAAAISAAQAGLGLPVTGRLDPATARGLLGGWSKDGVRAGS